MSHRYSWLVTTKSHGVVQVDGDRVTCFGMGTVVFFRKAKGGEYVLCAFGPDNWTSVEVMSQLTGYGNGFTPIKMESLNAA